VVAVLRVVAAVMADVNVVFETLVEAGLLLVGLEHPLSPNTPINATALINAIIILLFIPRSFCKLHFSPETPACMVHYQTQSAKPIDRLFSE
jgi:hypothetical protein